MRIIKINTSSPLHGQWHSQLSPQFDEAYMQALRDFLKQEKAQQKLIYPPSKQVFRAFELTPLEKVKVVILGQDPYHGPGQAQGLSFSVPKTMNLPPSLRNIYQELQADLSISPASHGCLEAWATQGVLLLNSVLTVEHGRPASHQAKGWEVFTDRVIDVLNQAGPATVFILWGAYAQKKGQLVDASKHKIIKSAHPSPFAAHKGFFGSRPFSQANAFLQAQGREVIDWALPSLT